MGNRHHSHILHIDGGQVERISDQDGKRYYCRTCGADRCRHIKRARETDMLHLAHEQGGTTRRR